jgi:S1-C subfamily serine protease
VIGINTAVVNAATGAHGIGFAIPAAQVRAIMEQLLTSGHVSRGWLGVQMNELTDFGASELGYTGRSRVVVDRVVLGSPAEAGGVERGDLVVHIAGDPVTSVRAVLDRIAEDTPGSEIKLGVWRGGKLHNLRVTLGERPDDVK